MDVRQSLNHSDEVRSEFKPRGVFCARCKEIEMNSPRYLPTVATLAAAMLCASNAYGRDDSQGKGHALDASAGALAAGTQYRLIGTDQVSFGPGVRNQARQELLFKLSAGEGEHQDSDDDSTVWSGGIAFDRIDFLKPGEIRMNELTDGLSYSAGIEVASTDDFDSQSEFVSSRQLGIHYGRLGPENYSSVDLGFRNYTDDSANSQEVSEDNELWSLGVTTGRRFALTGLDSSDPLWTVSLRGQFSTTENDTIDEALDNQQWYVSPGLQWAGDSFKLTADVLMPFMQSGELEDESDYRVRAKIQKNF